MRQVGSVIGVAILGTLISNAYASRVDTSGLPAAAADVVRQGVAGGVEVATKAGDAVLLASVRSAFVSGMDIMLWTCGGIAVACALLAVVFLRKLR